MARVEKQITINAPADKVFSYLADFARHSEWAMNPLDIKQTSQGPVQIGATFATTAKMMGTHNAQLKVTEFSPNSRLAFEAEDDTGRYRHYFQIEADGQATRLTKGVDPLRMSLTARVGVALFGGRFTNGDLKRIKAKVEGS